MKRKITMSIWFALFMCTGAIMADEMVMDDFADADGISRVGTQWQGFTDRVMGGNSDISAGLRKEEAFYLRMEGEVSLENNGGFIQVRLPLAPGNEKLNASRYSGIKVRYRTFRSGKYYLHLRTLQTRLPWAHFAAALLESSEWSEARIPWGSFESQLTLLRRPNTSSLTSIALVAAKQEFTAGIDIEYISLY